MTTTDRTDRTDLLALEDIHAHARRLRAEEAEAKGRVADQVSGDAPSPTWAIDYMERWVAASAVSRQLDSVLDWADENGFGAAGTVAEVRSELLRSLTYTGPAVITTRRLQLAQALGYLR